MATPPHISRSSRSTGMNTNCRFRYPDGRTSRRERRPHPSWRPPSGRFPRLRERETVAEAEERILRVEGHVRSGCLHRRHAAWDVERQAAPRRSLAGQHIQQRVGADAPVGDDRGSGPVKGSRIAGRSRKTSTTVGTCDATARTWSITSAGKSRDPAWKKFSNAVARCSYGACSRRIATSASEGVATTVPYLAAASATAPRHTASRRGRKGARGRRYPSSHSSAR